jgi:hypothetical protein
MRSRLSTWMVAASAMTMTVTGLSLCSGARQAHARWKPEFANAPYRAWYEQQHDREGWSCCDHADAHDVYSSYFRDGKWYVPIDGIDHEVLPHQLLDGANPTGHAVVWYDGAGDHITIFCFAPGTLS